MSSVEWPTHVTVNALGAARGVRKAGDATGKEPRGGLGGCRFHMRWMRTQRKKSRNPWGAASGQGFRKPPPAR